MREKREVYLRWDIKDHDLIILREIKRSTHTPQNSVCNYMEHSADPWLQLLLWASASDHLMQMCIRRSAEKISQLILLHTTSIIEFSTKFMADVVQHSIQRLISNVVPHWQLKSVCPLHESSIHQRSTLPGVSSALENIVAAVILCLDWQ
jgi:hypothetical protein